LLVFNRDASFEKQSTSPIGDWATIPDSEVRFTVPPDGAIGPVNIAATIDHDRLSCGSTGGGLSAGFTQVGLKQVSGPQTLTLTADGNMPPDRYYLTAEQPTRGSWQVRDLTTFVAPGTYVYQWEQRVETGWDAVGYQCTQQTQGRTSDRKLVVEILTPTHVD
jgi:hypothetical protein